MYVFTKLKKHKFLFEELVRRDFAKKYKRTVLGMGWSMLMPLLTLLVMKVVFEQFFGRDTPHYTTYIFCGNIMYAWFADSTKQGMLSLYANANIFTKVNVPKYMFLFSKNVQTLLNFFLSLLVFFVFCWLDHVDFTWKFVLLAYPVATMLLFTVGIGLVMSALFVFFRDMDYLWTVFLQLLMYGSAVFYSIDRFPAKLKIVFALNPVYRHIEYVRDVVLASAVPSLDSHLTLLGWAVAAYLAGVLMYKHYNTRFLYYV